MTTITYPFAPTSLAALLDVEMPSTFSKIHSYILYRLQLPDWKLSKADVANRFDTSMSTVKRAFRWLREHGYLKHDGLNNWQAYPSPNLSKGVNNEPLYIEVSLKRNITTTPTAPAAPAQKSIVVVDELIFPVQLNPSQKKACKSVIKKVKQPELQQPVLFALAYAMTQHKINSVPAYLQGLVKRANNGTFEATQADSSINTNKPLIPIWQGHKEAPKIDNKVYFDNLLKQYGTKVLAAR